MNRTPAKNMDACSLTVNPMKENALNQEYKTQGCTNPGHQVPRTTKFCTVAPTISGPSVSNVLYVKLVVLYQEFISGS